MKVQKQGMQYAGETTSLVHAINVATKHCRLVRVCQKYWRYARRMLIHEQNINQSHIERVIKGVSKAYSVVSLHNHRHNNNNI